MYDKIVSIIYTDFVVSYDHSFTIPVGWHVKSHAFTTLGYFLTTLIKKSEKWIYNENDCFKKSSSKRKLYFRKETFLLPLFFRDYAVGFGKMNLEEKAKKKKENINDWQSTFKMLLWRWISIDCDLTSSFTVSLGIIIFGGLLRKLWRFTKDNAIRKISLKNLPLCLEDDF